MRPLHRRFTSAAVLTLAATVAITAGGQAPGNQNLDLPKLPNPYRTAYDIVKMPAGRTMGSTNAINVDAKGNIWVFERCGANTCAESTVDPILEFDPSGQLIRSFGAGKFVFPHGVEFDRDGNVWIVDAGVVEGVKGNQIIKYSPDGKILLELGKPGVRGTNESRSVQRTVGPRHCAERGLVRRRRTHQHAIESPHRPSDQGREVHGGMGHAGHRARSVRQSALPGHRFEWPDLRW